MVSTIAAERRARHVHGTKDEGDRDDDQGESDDKNENMDRLLDLDVDDSLDYERAADHEQRGEDEQDATRRMSEQRVQVARVEDPDGEEQRRAAETTRPIGTSGRLR